MKTPWKIYLNGPPSATGGCLVCSVLFWLLSVVLIKVLFCCAIPWMLCVYLDVCIYRSLCHDKEIKGDGPRSRSELWIFMRILRNNSTPHCVCSVRLINSLYIIYGPYNLTYTILPKPRGLCRMDGGGILEVLVSVRPDKRLSVIKRIHSRKRIRFARFLVFILWLHYDHQSYLHQQRGEYSICNLSRRRH